MTSKGRKAPALSLTAWFVVATVAFAGVHCRSREQVPEPTVDLAREFAAPGVEARPMFRWWWPGGQVDRDEIVREVHQIADAGFGGVEIADVWDSAVTIDPVQYGFGTPAWNQAVEAALRAAKERGLRVDLTIGPHWPSLVPSEEPNGPEFAKEIVHGQALLGGGATFDGPIPEPVLEPRPYITEKTLIAVQAVRCAASCSGDGPSALDETTLVDLTASVEDGRVTWTAPAEGEWILVSFWMRGTGQRSAMYGPNPDNSPLTDPDCYVVDHFGAAGTEAVTRYWETTLLTPGIRALLEEVGGAIFEDSLELQTNGHWTPGFLDEFEKRRGYSFRPYLALIPSVSSPGFPPQSSPVFTFEGDLAERVRHDYEQTLSDLWLERRIEPFTRWTRSLGMEYRNQGYGEPVDSILSAATTDIPEGESLGFGDNAMDAFRALAAGRDLGGKRLLSDEVGAFFDGAYATTWHQMLSTLNANYAGGVNQMVLHGFAYADAPNATWPGFQPFSPFGGMRGFPPGPGFAEGWGPRQPTWAHIEDISGYLARTQTALQAGRAQVDVAVYRQTFNVGGGGPYLADRGLARAGYTYGFVSHGVLELPGATVENGRLAPDGPSYGALVLNQQGTMPLDTARRVLDHARAGLPIIVVGPPPSRTPGYFDAAAQDAALQDVIEALLAEAGVRHVESEAELVTALQAMNVRPAAALAPPADVVSVRRRDGRVDLFYFYNGGEGAVDTTVSLGVVGQTHELDAWTGTVRPVAFVQTEGRTELDIHLEPQQTTIIAVSAEGLLGGPGSPAPTTAPDRSRHGETADEPAPRTLSSWHLSVEDWRPGATVTETRKVPHEIDLEELAPWSEIPGLEDASGIGRYTTTVSLGPGWSGATLDLGEVMDTCRVTLNGQALPPVDLMDPTLDVGPHLKEGENTLMVEVTTPLGNRLRDVSPAIFGRRPRADYGLLGPVVLRSHGQAAVGER